MSAKDIAKRDRIIRQAFFDYATIKDSRYLQRMSAERLTRQKELKFIAVIRALSNLS